MAGTRSSEALMIQHTRRSALRRAAAVGGLVAAATVVSDVVKPAAAHAAVSGLASCPLCGTLAFPGIGACPAGGVHQSYGSFNYHVTLATDGGNGQRDWMGCAACACLWWSAGLARTCAGDPNGHRISSLTVPRSRDLLVEHLPVPAGGLPRQLGWRSCDICTLLFFSPSGTPGGRCPAGGPHVANRSWNYHLAFESS
jgi:hypothetical protein